MIIINFFIPSLFLFFFSINSYANTNEVNVNQVIQKQIELLKSSQNFSLKDIESLGLDNVDKKNNQPEISNNKISNISQEKPLNDTKNSETNIKNDSKVSEIKNNIEEKNDETIDDLKNKIVNSKNNSAVKKLKSKNIKKNKLKNTNEAIDLDKEFKNEAEKKKLLIENQMKLEEEKKAKEKEERFLNFKRFYLPLEEDENFLNINKNIIPVEKNLSPYLINELPPLPILSRTRAIDNYHIPFVYTPKEYIDSMFASISIGSVSYFNEAFKYVLNPNIMNDQGDTALTYAIFLKKYSIMASLLAKGADPNMPNSLGHLPTSIAIEMLDFVALEMLIKNYADVKYKDAFGRNHLMHASRVGFLPAVDLLVKNGVDVNEMDNDGFTALSIAYRHKKELIVQYLLKNGAKTWIEKDYNPEKKYFINDLNNRWK